MKKLTKLGIEELRKTLPVLSREEQQEYVGMYRDDCFWQCVAYMMNNGMNYSDAMVEQLALDFFAGHLFGQCGDAGYDLADEHLRWVGAGIDLQDMKEFMASMGLASGQICIIENAGHISAYQQRNLGYTGMNHAVIAKDLDKLSFYDPQWGFDFTVTPEEKRLANIGWI